MTELQLTSFHQLSSVPSPFGAGLKLNTTGTRLSTTKLIIRIKLSNSNNTSYSYIIHKDNNAAIL